MLYGIRFEVFGKVQGVWFRKHTAAEARRLGLVGWVRNVQEHVQGVAQGEEDHVRQL